MQSVNILSSVISVRRHGGGEGDEGSSLYLLQRSFLPITPRVSPATAAARDDGIDGKGGVEGDARRPCKREQTAEHCRRKAAVLPPF